ncbi:SURF1 family cytochrome oxidase biogenesis protein [Mycetocola reblochoni]|uniref:SURF1-like protein n=2 Tax=Mycetocola reblochoni TaxID=331618 RepID=A0A1R4J5R1_9MICO|nr:SURF1 family protein [Mycetocola reblochoni]RLP69571.1 SURF1 family protein [Mycetocola reblochoni]SJN27264.1 Cytochrome oxidase biogenesis protein Surf1, facilitates heme A insertion [Mycetocola reblochoni REB411]
MIGWRFLLSARWGGYLALAMVFAIVCCLLGNWQFARRAEARIEIDRILGNYDATPVPLADAMPDADSFSPDDKWLPVEVTGEYLVDEQMLVRNRPRSGTPGFEVLVPFQTTGGAVFLVDRGWLTIGNLQDTPDVVPEAPGGEITVVARLKAAEPALAGRTAPEGQVATIEVPAILDELGHDGYTAAYGLLVSETPAPGGVQPALNLEPVLDEGPHLSYAVQWYIFALLGFGGLAYAARQEYRTLNEDDPAEQERARQRREKRERGPRSDADIEDALLDGDRER